MQKKRKPLGLEALEDRWVPATVRFDGSNLFVSNPLVTAGALSLKVTEGVGNAFTVLDGVANNGTFAVTGNITVMGNNAKDTVIVKVNATGLTGNVSVSTGNGASSVTLDSTVVGGFVAGNTSINMGNGANSVWVGNIQGGGGVGVTERGSLTVFSRGTGTSSLFVGGAANPTSVLGNAEFFGFPTAKLGATGDIFAGNVTLSNTTNGQVENITLGAKFLSNVNIQGGQGQTTVTDKGSVLGNLQLNLGNGGTTALPNSLVLGVGGTTITLNNLFYLAGNGANSVTITAGSTVSILGSEFLNWGNGSNSFGASTGLTVNGNVQVNDGNGGLNVAPGAGTSAAFTGVVFGSVNVNAGNGPNQFDLSGTLGASVGGSFNYTGGNGGNSVTIDNGAPGGNIALNVRFGNLPANLFTISAVTQTTNPGSLSGQVVWAVPSTADANPPLINGFSDNGYIWTNAITLINIPS